MKDKLKNDPALIRQIISYVSTFLTCFLPILTEEGRTLLLTIYNEGWTWALLISLGGVALRSAVKAITQLAFCQAFPTLFKPTQKTE